MRFLLTATLAVASCGALICAAPPATASDAHDARLDKVAHVGGARLELNGAGVEAQLIFSVYAIGLYLPQRSSAASEVMAVDGPRRVAILMLRDVSGDDFHRAVMRSLATDGETLRRAAGQADQFGPVPADRRAAPGPAQRRRADARLGAGLGNGGRAQPRAAGRADARHLALPRAAGHLDRRAGGQSGAQGAAAGPRARGGRMSLSQVLPGRRRPSARLPGLSHCWSRGPRRSSSAPAAPSRCRPGAKWPCRRPSRRAGSPRRARRSGSVGAACG